MTQSVTTLLVSHDGARWLPAVLDGLAAQSRAPDRVVAVDTGSGDASADLLRERLGAANVLAAPGRSGYAEAVRLGLAAAPMGRPGDGVGEAGGGEPDEWVWLLHDDGAPAPDALERLLAAAAKQPPAVSILGPKLREWPSLRRLLEVGVTISGTGRRETGLERGEYDQGQHDRGRDVLAVNTAGMLVRRGVLERLGFEPRLPIFGNDIDFGWRAARQGHRTVVVPDAVMFHVEAAHRGVRRTPVTGGFRRGERRAAIYTLLVGCSARALPVQTVRLAVGSLLRALALVLVRAPGEALDELVGAAAAYVHPLRILTGRRARRRVATVPPGAVRHLLAPWWLPYRHGLDFIADFGTALAHQAGDMSAARRSRAEAAIETGPVAPEAQNLPPDTGALVRLLRSPVAAGFVLLVVGALVAARGLVGPGMLSGGALLPAPAGASHWWQLYLSSWHVAGVGSAAPAAPYLLPLALAGSILLGKAWLVVDLLFLFAVPLAAWGGYRLLLALTGSRAASLWGAASYGLLTVLTGAVPEGRLGTVGAAVLLPWLAHAALFLGARYDTDRRWRAAWRSALLLALLTAFAPLAWVVAAVLSLLAVLSSMVGRVRDARPGGRVRGWLPLLTPSLASLVLLLPWSVSTWAHRGAVSWLLEAGLPVSALQQRLNGLDVLLGRPGVAGAPAWLSAGVVLAGLVALARPDTRARALRPWTVLVVALLVVLVVSYGRFVAVAGVPALPVYVGFPVLLAQAAAVTAAAVAGSGIGTRLTAASFGWRQPLGALVVVVAVLGTVAGFGWWVWQGSGGPLHRAAPTEVPAYMTDAAAADPAHGVLVVRGSRQSGLRYLLLRGPGLRLGDDSVLPAPAQQARLTRLVATLATGPEPPDVARLAAYGVAFVYAPPPADPVLVGNLDSASGVTLGSAVRPGARAWQISSPPRVLPAAHPDPVRPGLLGAQALAVLVALVLAAPSRRPRR